MKDATRFNRAFSPETASGSEQRFARRLSGLNSAAFVDTMTVGMLGNQAIANRCHRLPRRGLDEVSRDAA